jgi:hypothetical protein
MKLQHETAKVLSRLFLDRQKQAHGYLSAGCRNPYLP